MTTGSVPGTHIVAPKQFQISGNVPTTVYFSYQQQAVPYAQYESYATYTGGNSLWIQGSTSWTQYATVPQGAFLSLLATSSTGGNGNLYEIYPDGRLLTNNYYYFPGYSQIGFWADTVGQHVLLFVINGQVSNPIVIDVVSYQPPVYQQPVYGQPSYVSPIYYRQTNEFKPASPWGYPQLLQADGSGGTSGAYQQSGYQQPETIPHPASNQQPETSTNLNEGDTPVHLISKAIKGYQLFLDRKYIGTDGAGSDHLEDGEIDFRLNGDQNHDIKVISGIENYQKTMYIQKGVLKTIYVEHGKGIYDASSIYF